MLSNVVDIRLSTHSTVYMACSIANYTFFSELKNSLIVKLLLIGGLLPNTSVNA